MMTLDEFTIGDHFYTATGKWLCVDKGSHFVIAIKIIEAYERDPSWLNGPPYSVVARALDRYDQEGCSKTAPIHNLNIL